MWKHFNGYPSRTEFFVQRLYHNYRSTGVYQYRLLILLYDASNSWQEILSNLLYMWHLKKG